MFFVGPGFLTKTKSLTLRPSLLPVPLMSDTKRPLLENATRDLARFASGLRYEELPKEVVERIKLCVLDHIGCALYGATLPCTRKVAVLASAEGARGVASLTGMGAKTSVALA